jgi:Rad3-related DNA helicase
VIRHVQDYGAIILIDERYNWSSNRSQITRWLRDRVRMSNSTEDLSAQLKTFFQDM